MLRDGKSNVHVADLMKKRPREITTAERALTEVDIFLKDWVREPNKYELVEDAQQAFNDLAKAVDGVEGDILEVKRRIAWTLISNPEKRDGRVYAYNFSFDTKTDEVIAALSERLSIDLTATKPAEGSGDTDEEIDIDFDDDENGSETSLENLIEAFDNTDLEQREAVSNELIEICNSIREHARQENVGNQALNAITAANTKLVSADLSKADKSTYSAIQAQLIAIKNRAETLEKTLLRYFPTDGLSSEGTDE